MPINNAGVIKVGPIERLLPGDFEENSQIVEACRCGDPELEIRGSGNRTRDRTREPGVGDEVDDPRW